MAWIKRWCFVVVAISVVAGCATKTKTVTIDFTKRSGVYVVGYSPDAAVRSLMENQMVSDFQALSVKARASHVDIDDIVASSRDEILAAANKRTMMTVLVINQVAADASDSVVTDPERISPLHPDLQAFYNSVQGEAPEPIGENQRVFAEVNLFLIDDDSADLYWTGTTWSVNADGRGGAVRDISRMVADQLIAVRETLTGD